VRRTGTWCILFIATLLAAAAFGQEPAPAPSVLLITLDTTRADHLGCYGAEHASTPHLDRLAVQGVLFENALSPAPLTLPSHASLFSGQVPRSHGARDNLNFKVGRKIPLLAEQLSRAGWSTAAWVGSVVLDRSTGLDRGFDLYDDTVRVGRRTAFDYRERSANQVVDAVIRDLPRIEPPFFLWVHLFDPHLPYVPPEPFRNRFGERLYDGEIAFVDHEIGRLLAAVRKRGGPLLVAVAGDHGESLGEHHEPDHGVFVYNATQHVPLILSGSRIPAGVKVSGTVGLVDLAPTVLDLLGLPPLTESEGRSLSPLFQTVPGKRPAWSRDYEMESMYGRFAYGWEPVHALVGDGHKYIDLPRPELYDLVADPGEANDLLQPGRNAAPDEKSVRTADRLRTLLQDRLRNSGEAGDGAAPIDPEKRAALESLGYVGEFKAAGNGTERSPVDPKDGIHWIRDLTEARKLCRSGKPESGIKSLRRLLARFPDNVQALLALAGCNQALNLPDRAAQACLLARDLAPDDSFVWFHLANARVMQDRKPEAMEAYEQALQLQPRFADAYLNYAAMLKRVGDDPAAKAVLQRAVEQGVDDPDIESELAVLLLKAGDVESARARFRRALELNPHAEKPRQALEMLK
jgi:arylsulfatase A-like enzyme/Flp pilus assembly protein TadD